MGNCCHSDDAKTQQKKRIDYLLWGSFAFIIPCYVMQLIAPDWVHSVQYLGVFSHSIYDLMNKMWWGVLLGIFFVGVIHEVPRDVVMGILGDGGKKSGIFRATLAGLLLDMCNHGILLIGMKFYERGASLGQVMAFLIASPWNSLSLTFILWALIGWKWTVAFIVFSAVIAVISGLIFERLVLKGTLPANPNRQDLPQDFKLFPAIGVQFGRVRYITIAKFRGGAVNAMKESRMVLRWVFLGVVLAGVVRMLMPAEEFQTFFGATLGGLGLTILAATIIEVCSEGSTPIAADLLNRAAAPGNAFAFLMTGVSTDYTEIMSLKETTKSWKISLFLPLVTVPQIVLLAWLMNAV